MFKILIAEEDVETAEVLSYNLKREGYYVLIAENSKDALDIATNEKPHLVILDVMMPGINCILACQDIRESNIVILAERSHYSSAEGFADGAHDHFIKPIKPGVFISRVKILLGKLQSEDLQEKIFFNESKINREQFNLGSEPTDLPKKEFKLLDFLAIKYNLIFRRSA